MGTDQNYANATLVVRENENYSIIKGRVDLRRDKPIRFLDLLNHPHLVGINTGVYSSDKIIVNQPEKHEIETSDIVIAYEEKEERGDKTERGRVPEVYKTENISLLTKDNKYRINGTVLGLKQMLNPKKEKKFIAFTKVKLEDLVTHETSEHPFLAINLEYFDTSKYK